MKRNSNNRRARKKGARVEGRISYTRVLATYGRHCHICDKPIEAHHILHFDHVIPLARQGAHAEWNIRPAHSTCNIRKNNRLMEELTPFDRRGPDIQL